MGKFTSKFKNCKEIIQKLNGDKKENCSRKFYNPVLEYNLINAMTVNFRSTYSKLFKHPKVKIRKLENCLPKMINIPKKLKIKKAKKVKGTLTQRTKITKKVFKSLKSCYIFIWCHHKNSKGTYVRSTDTQMWDYVKVDMSL